MSKNIGSIEKIVGKTAFARLKKKGLHTGRDISKSTPEEVMEVAGVGPKRLTELYVFLGLTINKSNIQRKYRRLKDKTKFKGVRFEKFKSRVKDVIEDPRKTIEGIERRRHELILWQNVLASTRNIGRAKEDRIQPLAYAPVSLVLDPFRIDSAAHPKDKIYGEVFITPELDRGKISYIVKDINDGDLLLTENKFFQKRGSVEMATDIVNTISEFYDRYRKRTLSGRFFVVLDKEYEDMYGGIKDKFSREIDDEKIILVPTAEEYFSWEALFKFSGNNAFERMVERFDIYHGYFLYDRYVRSGGKIEFDKWVDESEEYKNLKFWKFMVDDSLSNQKSHIVVRQSATDDILFGVIKGFPDLFRHVKELVFSEENLPFIRDEGYIGYKEVKKEIPVNVLGVNVPQTVIAIVHATLDKFKVAKDIRKKRIIFQSVELPEIGILYEKKVV